jgi:hypothetical protein
MLAIRRFANARAGRHENNAATPGISARTSGEAGAMLDAASANDGPDLGAIRRHELFVVAAQAGAHPRAVFVAPSARRKALYNGGGERRADGAGTIDEGDHIDPDAFRGRPAFAQFQDEAFGGQNPPAGAGDE